MTFPTELQAARLHLVKSHPYLASAAWALQPVQKPGLQTLALDMWWRLYYDPAVIQRWSVEMLSGLLYHELMHLLRDHAKRMRSFDRRFSNICADAEINDDLIAEGISLPADSITPASIGQEDGLLAEEYYAALERQAQESTADQIAPAQLQQSSAGEPEVEDHTKHGDGSGSNAGDSDSSKLGDEGKADNGHASSASSQPSDSSAQSGATSQHFTLSGKIRASGQDAKESGNDQMQIPAPGAGRCGSCATGQQESWEEGPPGEKGVSSGTSKAEGELIRRDVARRIQEYSQSQSDIPGHWVRWAEEKISPKVDWRKELAAAIRHAVTDVAGVVDYSYRRPSRRQGQVGDGKVVFPTLRKPDPSLAVIVDTSGSISDTMLSQALAEISGVLKGIGQREGLHVLAVDEVVHTCQKVFRPEQITFAGGGGTNMSTGLEVAANLSPAPQVVIVITDGWTPWPETAPRGMKVIVALTGDGNAPDWAKTVKIEKGGVT